MEGCPGITTIYERRIFFGNIFYLKMDKEGVCVVQRPPSRVDSETRFVLCNVPPSRYVRSDPRGWTPQPPAGVCYQALSWLLLFAFMAVLVLGSKKRTQT